jgi:hypothetical protein
MGQADAVGAPKALNMVNIALRMFAMQLARPFCATHPRHFGRGPVREIRQRSPDARIPEDLKLFATTFIAGFIFVSLLIA